MAKKLKVGDTLRGYRVTKVFGAGMMAISYAAESPSGRKIFLKQYKSPAPTVVWYKPFVEYQQELAARVRNGKAAHYAVKLLDAFEEKWGGPCYLQAIEFVEHGSDLAAILEEERAQHQRTGVAPVTRGDVWAQHVTWAKVFMAGIAGLHEAKIVHADLKPANAFLIRDTSIAAGYQLKLIDMDFSVLADRRAPWHGHQGYIGSDNYRSPEHMTRGAVPVTASDVFTCGLILYELLAGTHPYWSDDPAEYARKVREYAAKPPLLSGVMLPPATNAETSAALHRCLDPDPSKRPTAAELRAILSGRGPGREAEAAASTAARNTAGPTTAPSPAAAATIGKGTAAAATATATATATAGAAHTAAGSAISTDRMRLVGEGGRTLDIGVRTEIGKHLARQFGSDAEFWDARQCIVERRADGQWQVTPVAGTPNETLLNGDVLQTARVVRDGDVLAVGRKAKGIVKLPLTLRAL